MVSGIFLPSDTLLSSMAIDCSSEPIQLKTRIEKSFHKVADLINHSAETSWLTVSHLTWDNSILPIDYAFLPRCWEWKWRLLDFTILHQFVEVHESNRFKCCNYRVLKLECLTIKWLGCGDISCEISILLVSQRRLVALHHLYFVLIFINSIIISSWSIT